MTRKIAFAAVTTLLVGCAKPPALSPTQAMVAAAGAQCSEAIDREIAANDTCPKAQEAARAHRECQIAFPKGVNLNCKDVVR